MNTGLNHVNINLLSHKQTICADPISVSGAFGVGAVFYFTNMAIEHPPFEDVFPVENGDFSMSS